MAGETVDENSPSQESVANFHRNADIDGSPTSIHHTLGPSAYQAAAGNHRHNGTDSPLLLGGVTINGATNEAKITSIINALVKLGAEDGTETSET